MCGIFAVKSDKQIDLEKLELAFKMLKHRGPDSTVFLTPKDVEVENLVLGFHRLAIVDLSNNGNQPFEIDNPKTGKQDFLLCNGEIYNYPQLRKQWTKHNYVSTSDCEIIIPLVKELGFYDAVRHLDAEFALIWWDSETKQIFAARDPIGIRPLFWGKPESGGIAFASEAKALHLFCTDVFPFPPGHVYLDGYFIPFRHMDKQKEVTMSLEEAIAGIPKRLEVAVEKRLMADAPIGFLLSGGLDSSLVCALAARKLGKIRTFSVGTATDAIDNAYAEKVAKWIGSEHTTVTFNQNEALSLLDELIRMLETWDITTIRASIGMYLVCKYIRQKTDIKVLLTGEISDELFGYKYTDFAPSPEEFQKEAQKRIKELYMYDVLRADRCISAHSIEARVPFGDFDFVDYVMSIPAKLKMNTYGKGKYLLRAAFKDTTLLPEDILFREKAAFSDAVGHSMVDGIKATAELVISDEELKAAKTAYPYRTPLLKEALLYRKIFEKWYPGRANLIQDYWLPNKSWENCNVLDPSARVLPNYGASGK